MNICETDILNASVSCLYTADTFQIKRSLADILTCIHTCAIWVYTGQELTSVQAACPVKSLLQISEGVGIISSQVIGHLR